MIPVPCAYPALEVRMWNGAFCVMGAMVGAGFASGREIMAFFSRYGAFSWPLIAVAMAATAGMIRMALRADSVLELTPRFGRVVCMLLFMFTGGAMLAAAGEMWALTLPVFYAREIGAAITLLICLAQQKNAGRIGAMMGKLLLPVLLLSLLLCLRSSGEALKTPAWTPAGACRALFSALGYSALNVTLSAGMICEAGRGKGKREKRRLSILCALMIGALMLLANGALLRHGEALDAALPVVALLRAFGKEGFYLSAAVLYLAVMTTLTAQVKGLSALLPGKGKYRIALSGVLTVFASLLGFQGIVGAAYPILGWAAMGSTALSLIFRRKKRPLPKDRGREKPASVYHNE